MRAPRGVWEPFPRLRKGWEGLPLVLLALLAGSAWRLQESCVAATVRLGMGTGAELRLSEADAKGATLRTEVKVEVVMAKEVVEEPGFTTMVGSGVGIGAELCLRGVSMKGTHLRVTLSVAVAAQEVIEESCSGATVGSDTSISAESRLCSSGVEGTYLELALVVVVVAQGVMEESFVGMLCRRKRQN